MLSKQQAFRMGGVRSSSRVLTNTDVARLEPAVVDVLVNCPRLSRYRFDSNERRWPVSKGCRIPWRSLIDGNGFSAGGRDRALPGELLLELSLLLGLGWLVPARDATRGRHGESERAWNRPRAAGERPVSRRKLSFSVLGGGLLLLEGSRCAHIPRTESAQTGDAEQLRGDAAIGPAATEPFAAIAL